MNSIGDPFPTTERTAPERQALGGEDLRGVQNPGDSTRLQHAIALCERPLRVFPGMKDSRADDHVKGTIRKHQRISVSHKKSQPVRQPLGPGLAPGELNHFTGRIYAHDGDGFAPFRDLYRQVARSGANIEDFSAL